MVVVHRVRSLETCIWTLSRRARVSLVAEYWMARNVTPARSRSVTVVSAAAFTRVSRVRLLVNFSLPVSTMPPCSPCQPSDLADPVCAMPWVASSITVKSATSFRMDSPPSSSLQVARRPGAPERAALVHRGRVVGGHEVRPRVAQHLLDADAEEVLVLVLLASYQARPGGYASGDGAGAREDARADVGLRILGPHPVVLLDADPLVEAEHPLEQGVVDAALAGMLRRRAPLGVGVE